MIEPPLFLSTILMSEDYENPWIYDGKEIDQESLKTFFGFVYIITDLVTDKKYIGKKFIWNYRKTKGGTRRKKQESDWKKYYSSNEEIKKLAKETPERFRREILHLCRSQGECGYLEVAEQIKRDVLYRNRLLQ